MLEITKSEVFKYPRELKDFLEEYSGGLETAKPFWLISWEWI